MAPKTLNTTASLVTAGILAAQVAMAYQGDDLHGREAVAKGEVANDRDALEIVGDLEVSDERGAAGSMDRMSVEPLVNDYPPGVAASRIQPYAGAGHRYTRLSEEALDGLGIDEPYGLTGWLDADLGVTYHSRGEAAPRHADVIGGSSIGGMKRGQMAIDPTTIGGAVTFRF
ncbi:hypothetical protein BOX17_02440 [Halomonas aestuarii]|uniref:TonB-dependent receptor n=1 Tax=Halomonas aestuarii TaxID=1897729 RepID=A0A1J0VD24_9GAMM|nr:hypothetical protein [Halomonas aestuarii]APE29919.1 hypothetical protein BOX17_02440 [Halomonas aestuarii]